MKTFVVAVICLAVVVAAKSKLRESKNSRRTRSVMCVDKIANCAYYTRSVCIDPQYSGWVKDNCCAYCSGPACTDAISNCADYTLVVCYNDDYATWVSTHCAKYCGKCGISLWGGAPTQPGMTSHTDKLKSCQDTLTNCHSYGSSVCTNTDFAMWSTKYCAKSCNKCGGSGVSSGGSPGCADKNSNCPMVDSSYRICTDAGARIYAQENCAMTCNMCSGSTSDGSVSSSGDGTLGCVYKNHVYRQGQTWKDACKYTCSCVDGLSAYYQCQELSSALHGTQCHLNPPDPGKCCQTPSCPTGYNIQYPPGYVEN